VTTTGFILKNALRNRRRFILTVSSVALSLFLFMLLQVILKGLTHPEATEEAALRIVTRHKVSLANMLPAKYKARLMQMPGVAHCSRLLWFGGIYQDEKNFFPQFACDPDTVFKVLSEARIAPDQLERFIHERTACVVGIKTMERFGWKIGDRITLLGAMWPCNPELTIRGIYSGGVDETNLFFHHDYFDELLGDKGFTGLFWIRAESPAIVPQLIEQVDAWFSNSDAETKTETEHSFQLGFVSMLGNVKAFIASISTVILFTLFLVTGSTMSMAVRERIREIAILKALGFRASHIFGLILTEAFGLALAGGVLGCAGAALLLESFDLYKLSRGMFVDFNVTWRMAAQGLLVAAALGIVSTVAPAWAGLKPTVVEALRKID
jgi:putative ABC transport system permease protein